MPVDPGLMAAIYGGGASVVVVVIERVSRVFEKRSDHDDASTAREFEAVQRHYTSLQSEVTTLQRRVGELFKELEEARAETEQVRADNRRLRGELATVKASEERLRERVAELERDRPASGEHRAAAITPHAPALAPWKNGDGDEIE